MLNVNDDVLDRLIRLALDMPEKAGLAVLLRLGAYDVWRGDLAEMRGDSDARPPAAERPPQPENAERTAELYDVLIMRRALSRLDERCLDILWMRHVENRGYHAIAQEIGGTAAAAEQHVGRCRNRAREEFAFVEKQDPAEIFTGIADLPLRRRRGDESEYERLRKFTA